MEASGFEGLNLAWYAWGKTWTVAKNFDLLSDGEHFSVSEVISTKRTSKHKLSTYPAMTMKKSRRFQVSPR